MRGKFDTTSAWWVEQLVFIGDGELGIHEYVMSVEKCVLWWVMKMSSACVSVALCECGLS